MGKLGGIILLSALALTGCSGAASAQTPEPASTFRGEVQPAFAGIYANMTETEMADVERQLCEHFAAGFTVDDAARVQGELFGAAAGDHLRTVAQAVEARGC